MTKMSKAQRTATLEAHALKMVGRYRSGLVVARPSTVEVLQREGWISGALARSGYVTRAGLIAAGVDMDAIHAEALIEDESLRVAVFGALVQRRGEVGPRFLVGRVVALHDAGQGRGMLVQVSFRGLPGLWTPAGAFVPIEPTPAVHAEALAEDEARRPEPGQCGSAWVAEIARCPRCGGTALEHAEARRNARETTRRVIAKRHAGVSGC